MLKLLLSLFSPTKKEGKPAKRGNSRSLSHVEIKAILVAIDSCKMEDQVESALGWIGRMYDRNFFSPETCRELRNYAFIKLEKIVTERVHREHVLPYIKTRADKMVQEERARNIRIVHQKNN